MAPQVETSLVRGQRDRRAEESLRRARSHQARINRAPQHLTLLGGPRVPIALESPSWTKLIGDPSTFQVGLAASVNNRFEQLVANEPGVQCRATFSASATIFNTPINLARVELRAGVSSSGEHAEVEVRVGASPPQRYAFGTPRAPPPALRIETRKARYPIPIIAGVLGLEVQAYAAGQIRLGGAQTATRQPGGNYVCAGVIEPDLQIQAVVTVTPWIPGKRWIEDFVDVGLTGELNLVRIAIPIRTTLQLTRDSNGRRALKHKTNANLSTELLSGQIYAYLHLPGLVRYLGIPTRVQHELFNWKGWSYPQGPLFTHRRVHVVD